MSAWGPEWHESDTDISRKESSSKSSLRPLSPVRFRKEHLFQTFFPPEQLPPSTPNRATTCWVFRSWRELIVHFRKKCQLSRRFVGAGSKLQRFRTFRAISPFQASRQSVSQPPHPHRTSLMELAAFLSRQEFVIPFENFQRAPGTLCAQQTRNQGAEEGVGGIALCASLRRSATWTCKTTTNDSSRDRMSRRD